MSYPGQPPMGIPGMPGIPSMPYMGAPPPIITGVMPMAHVSKLITFRHDMFLIIYNVHFIHSHMS